LMSYSASFSGEVARDRVGVMDKLEAIKVLETRMAAIEREHDDELAGADTRSDTDARAEAKALAATYDFLKDCKIAHRQSLLRILERYLRRKSSIERGDAPIIQGVEGSREMDSATTRQARGG
jgi:hypothetical protein